jgi:rhodanese-related sulfurtransferase
MAKTIRRDELQQAIAAGAVTVVETLRTEQFADGRQPGAIHIHLEDIAEQAPTLLPDEAARIVTHCSNTACRNSEAAANERSAMACTNVAKHAHGKQDWQAPGLPLETEATVEALQT